MSAVLNNITEFPLRVEEQPTESQRKKDNDGIHKRRGIWHFKIKVAGRWKEMSTHTTNYQEARKYRNKTLRAHEEGRLPTDMASWTFTKVAEHWIEARKKLVSLGTWRIDKNRLQRLKEAFPDKRLTNITASEIEAYRMRRLEKVSPATVNSEVKVLRLILKAAKVWARLADDVKPLRESKEGPGRVLSQEEEKKLFETAISDEKANAVYFAAIVAANTSARGGELKRLRLKDVDVMNRTLTIRRDSTKTDAGCRIIPLNETATLALVRLLDRAWKLKSREPEHYLFPGFPFRRTKEEKSRKGSGYDPNTHQVSWRTSWRRLATKSGLPKLRFHDLRHHCITRLAENGVADQTVMAIAGHVSKAMLDHYSHVRLQARRDAVAALDAVQPQAASEATADATIVENAIEAVHTTVHTEVDSTCSATEFH